jgi:hypothetical protein
MLFRECDIKVKSNFELFKLYFELFVNIFVLNYLKNKQTKQNKKEKKIIKQSSTPYVF